MGSITRILIGLFVLVPPLLFEWSPRVRAQQLSTTEEERLQLLTDPDAIKKKQEKDKSRPPVEFFRSQVAPFDVLPFVKENHWNTFLLDLKSNDEDYQGFLQSTPLRLLNMPQDVVFGREARLIKEQRSTLGFQVLCSSIPKEMPIELIKPGAIRADGVWQASLLPLPPQQMLVMILSKEATSHFNGWSRFPSTIPASASLVDLQALELQRYYRLVLPTEADKFYLSPHPLAWSTLSHVIWDGISPDALNVSQQQAMLDWLHWGGQLIVCGGPSATATLFRESFLAPYLPGERTGENTALKPEDLQALANAYPPSTRSMQKGLPGNDELEIVPRFSGRGRDVRLKADQLYQPAQPILPGPNEPIYLSEIRPNPGASTIPLGSMSSGLLAVESRVGRGRITMLTINPNEPALVTWPGLDTLIRRVVLRRPEEKPGRSVDFDLGRRSDQPDETANLTGPDLSWYRIAGRDGLSEPTTKSVGAWLDAGTFPRLSRDLLEEASGISIPSSKFVLKVILLYLIALVPLNWLFCRFVLRRKEWSWAFIPLLSLAFAIGVERMAAFDIGFDSSCDEIDLLEIQGNYGRAHLSRFTSLFTTGRGLFSLTFPNDPTALALPLDTGRSIGGEDISTSNWHSYPVPTLSNFSVQPRSLGMVRAEQMLNFNGGISIEQEGSTRRVTNRTELELRDAVLVTFEKDGRRVERSLGKMAAGASVEIKSAEDSDIPDFVDGYEGPDPSTFLTELRRAHDSRPENAGEIRFIAWTPKPMSGMKIEPVVDRYRGSTVVVAHLRVGPTPDPSGPRFNQYTP